MATLVPVCPTSEQHCHHLYEFLRLRLAEPERNISHRDLPAWRDHVAFVRSKPYARWYLIEASGQTVGSVYLTTRDEIGVYVAPDARGQGVGKRAVKELMRLHPRKRYYANINPDNNDSQRFFAALGGRLLQVTYEVPA